MDYKAFVVLNTRRLMTVEAMERTLAHEYGHHWTMPYMLHRLGKPGDQAASRLYYRIRGIVNENIVPLCEKEGDWFCCDKEILAEDYKFHFSPFRNEHKLAHLYGNPTSEVRDYIWALGKPHFI